MDIKQTWNINSGRPDSLYHMRKDEKGKTTHFGPDETELAVHEATLNKILEEDKNNGKVTSVLVLGATPELRDLALIKNCKVVSVDMNKTVVEAAKLHLNIADRENENVIIGDWSSIPVESNSISFIMGSASLNNVPLEKLPDVLNEINRVLRTNGVAHFRQITFPDIKKPEYDVNNVIQDYRDKKLSKREFYVILRFYSFLKDAYNEETKVLYAKTVFDDFDNLYKSGLLTETEHLYLTSFRNAVEHTVFSQSETKELLEKYFKKVNILHGTGEKYFDDIYNIFEIKK